MSEHLNGTPPKLVALPPEFDDAIIGQSVFPGEHPRFAYSLTKLVKLHQTRTMTVSLDAVRADVWEMVGDIRTKNGNRSPLFIDDAATYEDAGPKIITPRNFKR